MDKLIASKSGACYRLSCDCLMPHVVDIDYGLAEDGHPLWFSFSENYHPAEDGWWHRLTTAIRIIFGRRISLGNVLLRDEDIQPLMSLLNTYEEALKGKAT